MNEVFISYSRQNEPFVDMLRAAFERQERGIWLDKGQIRGAEDWMEAIRGAIEAADALLFVITPDSVASMVCRQELEHALTHSKRLIPILRETTPDDDVPDELRRLNYLNFLETTQFDASFAQLIETLDTDLEWVRLHTRYLVRARQWVERGRDATATLRGTELEIAQQWLDGSEGKEPSPAGLHREFIGTSRRVSVKRQRSIVLGVSVALVLTTVAAVIAVLQRNEAQRQSNIATARMHVANGEASFPGEPLRGLTTALAGWRLVAGKESEVATNLAERLAALAAQGRLKRLGTDIQGIHSTPDDRYLLLANRFLPARLVDSETLEPAAEVSGVVHAAPVPVGETDAYFAIRYAREDGLFEIRRAADAQLVGRTRRITERTLFPAALPKFVLEDYGFSPKVVRMDDDAILGPDGFDVARLFYEPSWPVFALVYRDDENTTRPPPPELFDVETGEVIATFDEGLGALHHGPDPAGSCLVVTNRRGKSDLRAAQRPGAVLALLPQSPSQVAFAPTVSGRYVLIAFDDRFEVRRCSDGKSLGGDALPAARVLARVNTPAWLLQARDSDQAWAVEVDGEGLRVDRYARWEPAPNDLSSDVPPQRTASQSKTGPAATGRPTEPDENTGPLELIKTKVKEDAERFTVYTLRRKSDGFVIYKTGDIVRSFDLLPSVAPAFVLIRTRDPDDRDERDLRLARLDNGKRIWSAGGWPDVHMPNDPTAPYFLVGWGTRKGEVRWLDNSRKPLELSAAVSGVSWGGSGEALYFIARFRDGRAELWRGLEAPRKLLDLGLGYAGHHRLVPGGELVVQYEDGRADVVDPDWLEGMLSLPESPAVVPLAQLLCNGVLATPWGERAFAGADSATVDAARLACPL